MRISDWSSDVCSSDLMKRLHLGERGDAARLAPGQEVAGRPRIGAACMRIADGDGEELKESKLRALVGRRDQRRQRQRGRGRGEGGELVHRAIRSEEHTSELQSLMRSSYAVFCLKTNNHHIVQTNSPTIHQTVTTYRN